MKYLQISVAIGLFATMLYLGQQRRAFDHYFAAAYHMPSYWWYTPERYTSSLPQLLNNVRTDYKWLAATSYTVAYLVLSVMIVVVLFRSTSVTLQHGSFLLLMVIAIGFFVGMSVLTGRYEYGYALAQRIKNLVQSPLPTLLSVLYFWKVKPTQK